MDLMGRGFWLPPPSDALRPPIAHYDTICRGEPWLAHRSAIYLIEYEFVCRKRINQVAVGLASPA